MEGERGDGDEEFEEEIMRKGGNSRGRWGAGGGGRKTNPTCR